MEYGFHYVESVSSAPQKFMLKEIPVDCLCCSVELISIPYLELKCASALSALVQSAMFRLVVVEFDVQVTVHHDKFL